MSLPDVPPGYPPRPVAVAGDVLHTVLDADGEVVCVLGTACADQLAANIPAGGNAVPGAPPSVKPSDSFRRNGAWVSKPAPPSDFHQWDRAAKKWFEPRSFAELKAAKWVEVKAARTSEIDAPLVTPYGNFDSNPSGRSNIADIVLMLNNMPTPPASIDFTLADNTTATLTPAQMVAVGLLLGQKVQGAYATARTLRAQIEAASSAGQLAAIKWPRANAGPARTTEAR